MITIVQFSSQQAAVDKMAEYDALAFPNGNPGHLTLTPVEKHTVEDIWWFSGTDCINTGGLGREEIEYDISLQDTFEIEQYSDLIMLGYAPQPDDN